LGILSRQYNLGREKDSSKRIMLKDVIKMIKEQINSKENIPDKYKNNGDVKIMLYLISCRGGDTKQEDDEKIHEAQQKVYDNGLYKITDIKTRSVDLLFDEPSSEEEDEDEDEDEDEYEERNNNKRSRRSVTKSKNRKKLKRGGGKKSKKKKTRKRRRKSVKK